jgi:hypothetical protein
MGRPPVTGVAQLPRPSCLPRNNPDHPHADGSGRVLLSFKLFQYRGTGDQGILVDAGFRSGLRHFLTRSRVRCASWTSVVLPTGTWWNQE